MEKRITKVNLKGKEVKEMKKMIKWGFVFAVVVLAFALTNTSARADTIMSLIVPGVNTASDQDREYLIDRNVTTVGQIDVGDSLRGTINFNTLNSGAANVGGITGNNELTGVFQLMVTSVTSVGPLFYFTFGPDPNFAADISGGIGAPVGFVPGAGAVAVLFEGSGATLNYANDFNDPAPAAAPPADTDADLTNGPNDDGTPAIRTINPPSSADVSSGAYVTEEAFLATARDGTWFATLGFLGIAGEGADFLTTLPGANTVLNAFTVTSANSFGTANLGLNLLALGPAATGLQVSRITPVAYTNLLGTLPPGVVDFGLTQNLKGVLELDTPFEISTNTDVTFNVVVPEPSTLLLLASGLLGVGALSRKRKMRK